MRKLTLLASLIWLFGTAHSQIIFQEDFEGGVIPTDWTIDNIDATANEGWFIKEAADVTYIDAADGKFATSDLVTNGSVAVNHVLITPEMNLTAESSGILSFDWFYVGAYGGGYYGETLNVYAIVDGVDDVSILSLNNEQSSDGWATFEFDMKDLVGKDKVQIAFSFNNKKINYDPNGASIDNVLIKEKEKNDVRLLSLDIKKTETINTDVAIMGTLMNVGADELTSVDIKWTDGTDTYTQAVTGLTIASGDEYTFTHETALNTAVVDDYTITVTLEKPNTVVDPTPGDNSMDAMTYIYVNSTPRTVLIENFACNDKDVVSSSLTQEAYLDGLVTNNVIKMSHHSIYHYYEDTLTNEWSKKMEYFEKTTYVWAKRCMIDRHYNGKDNDDDGDVEPDALFNSADPNAQIKLDERLAAPAFVNIAISSSFDEVDSLISVTVSGSYIKNYSQDLGVSLWLVEDNVVDKDTDKDGNDNIYQAGARVEMSDEYGTAITSPTQNGDTYSLDFEYSIKGNTNWKVKDLKLVAFVNNMSDNIKDREVHNATAKKLIGTAVKEIVFNVKSDGKDIEGAKVTSGMVSELTNADGIATIEFKQVSGTINYSVTRQNYNDYNSSFDIATTSSVEVELVPNNSGSKKVTFTVESNGQTIEGANVVSGSMSELTNADGVATIDFAQVSGTVSYTVSKDNYTDYSSTFDIAATDAVKVELTPVSKDITFTVKSDGQVVKDAKITIGSDSEMTDANGQAMFTFNQLTGIFDYVVTKDKYTDVKGKVDIETTDKVDVDMIMVGIHNTILSNMEIYPNPFSDVIVVKNLDNASLIVIRNVIGQSVKIISEFDNTIEISMSDFNKGVYIISVTDINNNIRTERLIKQ